MFRPLLTRRPQHSYGRHPATDPLARPSESMLEDRCAGGRAGTDHGGADDRPGHPQQGCQHRAHHSRECARHYLHKSQVEHFALGRPFFFSAILHQYPLIVLEPDSHRRRDHRRDGGQPEPSRATTRRPPRDGRTCPAHGGADASLMEIGGSVSRSCGSTLRGWSCSRRTRKGRCASAQARVVQ